LSAAIVQHAQQRNIELAELTTVRSIAGRGVSGVLADSDQEVLLGSAPWLRSLEIDLACEQNDAQVYLACAGQLVARYSIRQRIRPQAGEVLATLRGSGGRTIILSGDQHAKAVVIAEELGCEVQAPLLPEDKLAVIRRLQAEGHRVVMVGDGLNDAPALAAADVGIALGCGADVSRWSGSLCLLSDDLQTLPWLVELSRRATRTIRWNLLWAFGYNAICIPLAGAGWLHPAMAAAAMVASSLLVVSNSLQLAREAQADGIDDDWPAPLAETSIVEPVHEVAA
jgi:P-type E1-E2 ATPase